MCRFIVALLMLVSFILSCGCSSVGIGSREQVLYSEIDPKLTEPLVAAYNEQFKNTKNFQKVKAIYELKDNDKPDLVLASTRTLTGLKLDNRLQTSSFKSTELLPLDYKDVEGYWTGVFYDPVVFIINQEYARRVGQQNLKGWNDLENLQGVRYVVESLNNSPGSMNLLAAMASHMGEQSAISFLWNLNRNVTQYAKFPFSSIRMVATGEADMTVTVQSMVFKYLESEFPAYITIPREGTPANLYGVAVFKGSESTYANQQFMDWLLTDDNPKIILQKADSGFNFLLPKGPGSPVVDPRTIWLNRDYLTLPKLEALAGQWLEKVRFSK